MCSGLFSSSAKRARAFARLFVQRVVYLQQDGLVALRNQRIRRVVGHAVRVCILPSSWAGWRSFPRSGQQFWTLQEAEVRANSGKSIAFTGDRRSVTVVHLADGAPTA